MNNSGGEVSTDTVSAIVFILYVFLILLIVCLVIKILSRKKPAKKSLDNPYISGYNTTKGASANSNQERQDKIQDIGCQRSTDINVSSSQQPARKHSTIVRQEYRTTMQDIYAGAKVTKNTYTYKMVDYTYVKKEYIMTKNETIFYRRLFGVIGKSYLIFPQLHLDALLDYKTKGQGYNGAYKSIRNYSVDYVLCDANLRIVCAIELDDSTHDKPERIRRDRAVEHVLELANLPLIRIRSDEYMSDDDLARLISLQTKQQYI